MLVLAIFAAANARARPGSSITLAIALEAVRLQAITAFGHRWVLHRARQVRASMGYILV
jgi:fatty-acid desaturase